MKNYKDLDPEVRAVALVGLFLQAFALLETAINGAMGKALGLTDLQTVIVARNVQFSAKINILRTALTVSDLTLLERDKYKSELIAISKHAEIRNMMAHNLFLPSDDGKSVEFLVTKAKGKLVFPEEVWSEDRIRNEVSKMNGWCTKMKKLESAISSATLRRLLADALVHQPTNPNFFAQEVSASPQFPGLLGNIPSSFDGDEES